MQTRMYRLQIENTCQEVPPYPYNLYNYIDNISLTPEHYTLIVENFNIPCQTGGTANFDIKAGIGNANKNYWMWISISGNYPGINVSGLNVPLNDDPLFVMCLSHPNFPGSTGWVDKLNIFGMASPTLTLPADTQQLLVGFPLHIAYVLTAPGPSLPLSYVSNPVHIKYVP